MKKLLAVLMLLGMALYIAEPVFARGGRGGGGRSGASSMGRSSRGSRGSNREKDVKRDRDRTGRENEDGFRRDAADDAE